MIVYRYQSITSLLNRQLFIFSQRGLDKNSCENFFKFLSDKICLGIAEDNKQYVGYLTKEEKGYYVTNPITKKIYNVFFVFSLQCCFSHIVYFIIFNF